MRRSNVRVLGMLLVLVLEPIQSCLDPRDIIAKLIDFLSERVNFVTTWDVAGTHSR